MENPSPWEKTQAPPPVQEDDDPFGLGIGSASSGPLPQPPQHQQNQELGLSSFASPPSAAPSANNGSGLSDMSGLGYGLPSNGTQPFQQQPPPSAVFGGQVGYSLVESRCGRDLFCFLGNKAWHVSSWKYGDIDDLRFYPPRFAFGRYLPFFLFEGVMVKCVGNEGTRRRTLFCIKPSCLADGKSVLCLPHQAGSRGRLVI